MTTCAFVHVVSCSRVPDPKCTKETGEEKLTEQDTEIYFKIPTTI
jgi:hypothetical protein